MGIYEGFLAADRLLSIFVDIDESIAQKIVKRIFLINSEDEAMLEHDPNYEPLPIEILLNSNGGYIYDALAIISAIQMSKTPVHITSLGKCMSMGLIILSVGHYRKAHKYTTFMYHESASSLDGKLSAIENETNEVKRLDVLCDNILLENTKLKKRNLEHFRTVSEYYFDSEEARKYGIIDEII